MPCFADRWWRGPEAASPGPLPVHLDRGNSHLAAGQDFRAELIGAHGVKRVRPASVTLFAGGDSGGSVA
jgi:hypothetical protein